MKIEVDEKQIPLLQEVLQKLLEEEEQKRRESILKIEAIFQLQNQLRSNNS